MTDQTYKIKWKYTGPLEGEITVSVEASALEYSPKVEYVRRNVQFEVEHYFESLFPVPVKATNVEEVVKLWKILEKKVAIDWSRS